MNATTEMETDSVTGTSQAVNTCDTDLMHSHCSREIGGMTSLKLVERIVRGETFVSVSASDPTSPTRASIDSNDMTENDGGFLMKKIEAFKEFVMDKSKASLVSTDKQKGVLWDWIKRHEQTEKYLPCTVKINGISGTIDMVYSQNILLTDMSVGVDFYTCRNFPLCCNVGTKLVAGQFLCVSCSPSVASKEFKASNQRYKHDRYRNRALTILMEHANRYVGVNADNRQQWENMLFMIRKHKKKGVTIQFADFEEVNVFISTQGRLTFRFDYENRQCQYFRTCLSPMCGCHVENPKNPPQQNSETQFVHYFCSKHSKDANETGRMPVLKYED